MTSPPSSAPSIARWRWPRAVVLAQALYYTVTGAWPLLSMSSFEAVTGEKTDDWLVQTVGLLTVAIAVALWRGGSLRIPTAETFTLAAGSALAFTTADVWFVASGTISPIYLLDVGPEVVFGTVAVASLWRGRRGTVRD